MTGAKALRVVPLSTKAARSFVRRHHYSGTCVQNSQIHLGIRIADRLVGVMQFGPPVDRRRMLPLVAGSSWSSMLELNRMACIDDTPRNTESRAIAVACRLLAERYEALEWLVSFADATRCGDGTIYRASAFLLTGITKNNQIWEGPNGDRVFRVTETVESKRQPGGRANMDKFKAAGYRPIPGYHLRYVRGLRPGVIPERLTVPVLPFSRIAELGAGMYRGEARP